MLHIIIMGSIERLLMQQHGRRLIILTIQDQPQKHPYGNIRNEPLRFYNFVSSIFLCQKTSP